ncbi:MAG: panthothenate synthetase [Bryobacteraceae bacterium]
MAAKILEQQKPEAAYFVAENGKRTGIFVINMEDASEIPAIAEPWFLALNAAVEVSPAMVPADLQKAAPAVAQAVKTYG